MDAKEATDKPEKKYSYLIYVVICLAITGLISYEISSSDPGTGVDYVGMNVNLVKMLVFSTLAWVIGRKYALRYVWICVLGAGGYVVFTALLDFFRGSSEDYGNALIGLLAGYLLGILVFSALIFAISYPFQYLFYKVRSSLKDRAFPK